MVELILIVFIYATTLESSNISSSNHSLISYGQLPTIRLSNDCMHWIDDLESNNLDNALEQISNHVGSIGNPKKLCKFWNDNQAPWPFNPLSAEPNFFYVTKLLAVTSLHCIAYYVENKLVLSYIEEHRVNLETFTMLIQEMTRTLLFNQELNKCIINDLDLWWKEIHLRYKDEKWYSYNKALFDYLYINTVQKPQLILHLLSLNMTIIDRLGSGSFGTVYKIKSNFMTDHNKFYALKSFRKMIDCIDEERIMLILKRFPSVAIADLRLNDIINCANVNAILMKFIDGFAVNNVPKQYVLNHPGGLIGFVNSMKHHIVSGLFQLMDKAPYHIRIYHNDLSSNNVMYDIKKKQFYVIDWSISHDMNNNSNTQFFGSLQNFGPNGWLLFIKNYRNVEQQTVNIYGNMSDYDWELAHNNDLYAVSAIQLELLGLYGKGALDVNIYHTLKSVLDLQKDTVEYRLNPILPHSSEFWAKAFIVMNRLWMSRSRLLYALLDHCSSAQTIPKIQITKKFDIPRLFALFSGSQAFYSIYDMDSYWFQTVGKDNWDKAVKIVHDIEMNLRQKMQPLIGHTIDDYRFCFALHYMNIPSFIVTVIDEEYDELLEFWKQQNVMIKDGAVDNIYIAQIGFEFLKLYCDQYMSNHCGKNAALIHKILRLFQNADLMEMRDTISLLKPQNHSLLQQIQFLNNYVLEA